MVVDALDRLFALEPVEDLATTGVRR